MSKPDTDGDLLLRNVQNIRKRLLHTERSLQLLQTPRDKPRYAVSSDGDSLADEPLPPLTLDDLTDDYSDVRSAERRIRIPYSYHSDIGIMQDIQGAHNLDVHQPFHQSKSNGAVQVPVSSVHDFENESLRKKLQALRDENSQLVSSNHKLLNELESTGYELRSTQNQLQVVSLELESTKKEVPLLRDKLVQLESSIRLENDALRSADQKLVEYEEELKEKDLLVKRGKEESETVKKELMYEMQQRKRAENQRDEALKNLEDISDQLNEYRTKTKDKLKKYQSTEDHLRDSLLHCDKEREELLEKATALEGELQDARENMRVLREESVQDMEATTHDLHTTISSLRDQMSHLQENLDGKTRENTDLKELTDRQNERLADCQRDIEASHSELKRLEEMARRLQDRMRNSGDSALLGNNGYDIPRPVRTSSPASDPGLGAHPGQRNTSPALSALSADQAYDTSWTEDLDIEGYVGGGSNRALIAQLRYSTMSKDIDYMGEHTKLDSSFIEHWNGRMKLAMKEAENQRLQAARQRDTAGVSLSSSGTMDGLRSELTALVEKNKIGDRKAQELSGIIGRLEEERTRHAAQLVRLQERLTEQEAHSTAVESQLDHYNAQLKVLHDEIEKKGSRVAALQAELEKRNGLIAHLEEHLGQKSASIEEYKSKLAELEQQLKQKTSELGELQNSFERKTEEADQTSETLTRVKELHVQHCQEMQQQIETLQENKDALSTQLQDMNQSVGELEGKLMSELANSKRLENELDQIKKELDVRIREHSETTQTQQLKANEDGYRISQLEAALLVCKEELTGYIERLDDMRDRHDKDLQDKKSEMRKLEKQLKQARDESEKSAAQVLELEQALEERQQMLQQSTARLAELEDKEGQLEYQVSHLEKGLNQVTTAAEKDAALIEKKLHQACMDLEDRTSQLTEATEALSKAQSELVDASTQSADLEQQLAQTRKDCDNHAAKATQLEIDLREAKLQLEHKTEKVSDLEKALEATRQENKEHRERAQELDGELRRAQLEMQTATRQLSELQRLLQRSRAETKQKQQRMQELTDELRRSQDEARHREHDMAEMDEALKGSQRELQHRAAQVSQLDLVVKEHQSESEQRILQLESSLNKSQYELKQCSRKIAELDDRCGEQQAALKERALQVQQLEQQASRQKNEISKKALEITQLQKRIEDLTVQCSNQREEELAQGQQLRLTREQMQRHHVELTEAKRQLAQVQREKEQLAREYEDAIQLCHTKDEDHARLAEEHGAVMAREAETETRFAAELERIRDLQLRELEEKDRELAQLQDSHAALLASKNQLEASHRLEINRLKDAETRSREGAESLREKIGSLENELQARKEVIDAANEAIVIKEAEVARLNARISGYERATFGAQFTTHDPPNRPSSATPSKGNAPFFMPPLVPPSSPQLQSPGTILRRSASDHHLPSTGTGGATLHNSLHNLQTGDLYSRSGRPGHSRHLTDTGYQSRGLYGSQDFHEPPTTHMPFRCDPRDLRSHDRVGDEPARLRHFSDTDSVEEEENFETFQGMLAFVNRQIANQQKQQQPPDQEGDSAAQGDSLISEHGQSLLASTTHEDSDLALNISELQEGRGVGWESPRKSRASARTSPRKLGNRSGVSPSSKDAADRSPGRGFPQGHRPKIMKSTGQADGLSPKSLPLKKRLASQRAKTAASKSATETPLKPEDCMADLQDRLRANDERRRRIDDQLYNMRDHARKITNRILGKDKPEDT